MRRRAASGLVILPIRGPAEAGLVILSCQVFPSALAREQAGGRFWRSGQVSPVALPASRPEKSRERYAGSRRSKMHALRVSFVDIVTAAACGSGLSS